MRGAFVVAQKGPHFVVSAQKHENGRIVSEKEESPQLETRAHFPQLERMQLPDAQAGMLLRVREGCSQVREDVKNR